MMLDLSHILETNFRGEFSSESLVFVDSWNTQIMSIDINWGLSFHSVSIVKLVEL